MTQKATELDRHAAAAGFLTTAFGDVPDEGHILIWTLDHSSGDPRKASRFFTDPTEAAHYSADASASTNVYVGIGWRDEDHGAHRRGELDDIAGIVGFAADVDIAGPGHSNKNYPATRIDAEALIGLFPVPPSLVVWTGGGLQPWWLFREPWAFESPIERATAASASKGWARALRQVAESLGQTIDSVFDLPRVFRVPGTYRTKPQDPEPRLVRLVSDNKHRYNPSDFESYYPPEEETIPTISVASSITIDPNAQPPFDKFMLLADIEPRFLQSFHRQRKDFKDQSQSSYDQSLANFAASANWTDQEIANLLIAARRNGGENQEKLFRLDYLLRTIAAARAYVREQADRSVELAELDTLDDVVEQGADRQEILDRISRHLKIQIARIIQTGRDKAVYSVILADGRDVPIGRVKQFMSAAGWKTAFIQSAQHALPFFEPPRWGKLFRAILTVVEVLDNGEDSRRQTLEDWLSSYLGARKVRFRNDVWAEALRRNEPFVKDGRIHVHAGDLCKFVKSRLLQPTEAPELRDMLGALGFTSKAHSGRTDSGVITRHYWSAPLEVVENQGDSSVSEELST